MLAGHPLAIAARTLDGLPPRDLFDAAASAGFDLVGLLVDPAHWTDADTDEIRRHTARTGVRVLDVEAARIKPGPPDPDLPALFDIAQAVGARHVLAIGHDADLQHTAEQFRDLCALAGPRGLTVALEFMAFRGVATLQDALQVVDAAGHSAGSILVDNHHLARTHGTSDDVRRLPANLVRYVQLCDAPAQPAGWSTDALMQDALEARCLPGAGALPVTAFLDALPPGTPISVEIIGRRERDRFTSPADYARAIMDSLRRVKTAPEALA